MKLSALLLSASKLHACAVCFGLADQSGLFAGLTWGLLVLLGFPFLAIGGIILAALRIEKNRAACEKAGYPGT